MTSGYVLRPRTAGELLDTALVVVKRHPSQILGITVWPYALGTALALLTKLPGVGVPVQLIGTVAGMMIGALVEARLDLAALDALEGRPFGSTPARPILVRRWGAISLGYLVKWCMVVAGFALLILPGAYLLALYFAVPALSAFENLGVRAARARSRALARKNIGRVVATIGFLDFMAMSLGIAVALLLRDVTSEAFRLVLGWGIGFVVAPVRASLVAAVYLDCRVRLEGYDLEQGFSALPAS